MRTLRFFLLLLTFTVQAAFTEFYVQTTANNLNAGSTTSDAAQHTYAAGTFVRSTGIFTTASENPIPDVELGDFASIYTTTGATVATFVARVTGTNATTITVSLTAIAGATSTVSEGSGEATCKIGGAWDGPAGAVGFPFGFVTATLTDASGNYPRVNFKNGVQYDVTAAMTHSLAGPVVFQGYTTSVGDGGRATIDGGTGGGVTYYILLTVSGANNMLSDLIFANNGGTGTAADGVLISGVECVIYRCVFHNFRKAGLCLGANVNSAIECEVYACNSSNTGTTGGGFNCAYTGIQLIRCISHDNVGGANCHGFVISAGSAISCIADSNAGTGFRVTGITGISLSGCDSYNNTVDGFDFTGASVAFVILENCNSVNNTGWGFNSSGSSIRLGVLTKCGLGSGTMINDGGGINTVFGATFISDTVTYAADLTPWTTPATGDFRISLATAKGTGVGTFTETAASYTGTIAYPDIGAAQHLDAGGAPTEHSHVFAQ